MALWHTHALRFTFLGWYKKCVGTNKTDRQDLTETLLKVALNTITLTITPIKDNQKRLGILYTILSFI